MTKARAAYYSALTTGDTNHKIILVPLPKNKADLDSVCHSKINSAWHAGGVGKGLAYDQDCGDSLDNKLYGGGYTSYVTEAGGVRCNGKLEKNQRSR